jgi:hypothetical protein
MSTPYFDLPLLLDTTIQLWIEALANYPTVDSTNSESR